jgi:hypothetical protein
VFFKDAPARWYVLVLLIGLLLLMCRFAGYGGDTTLIGGVSCTVGPLVLLVFSGYDKVTYPRRAAEQISDLPLDARRLLLYCIIHKQKAFTAAYYTFFDGLVGDGVLVQKGERTSGYTNAYYITAPLWKFLQTPAARTLLETPQAMQGLDRWFADISTWRA